MTANKRPLGVGVALALNGELGGVAAYWTHWLGHCVQRSAASRSGELRNRLFSVKDKISCGK